MADVLNSLSISLAEKASNLVDNLADKSITRSTVNHAYLSKGILTNHDFGDSIKFGLLYGTVLYTMTDIMIAKDRQRTWQGMGFFLFVENFKKSELLSNLKK